MHNQEITPKSEKQTHVLVGVTDNIFFLDTPLLNSAAEAHMNRSDTTNKVSRYHSYYLLQQLLVMGS